MRSFHYTPANTLRAYVVLDTPMSPTSRQGLMGLMVGLASG
jgi:hypothetical protein